MPVRCFYITYKQTIFSQEERVVMPTLARECFKHVWPYINMIFFVFWYHLFLNLKQETNLFVISIFRSDRALEMENFFNRHHRFISVCITEGFKVISHSSLPFLIDGFNLHSTYSTLEIWCFYITNK